MTTAPAHRPAFLRVAAVAVAMGTLWTLGGLLAARAQSEPVPTVVELSLDGVADPLVADQLQRSIAEAADAGDAAVILRIDAQGGLEGSTQQIVDTILGARIPVIGYVAPSGARAASAGAFVLMSTPIAAMAPGTDLGPASPVGLSAITGSDAAVGDAAATMRDLAQQRGRDPELAATLVTEAASMTAEQAQERGLIDVLADTPAELLVQVDGSTVRLADGSTVTLATAGATIEERGVDGVRGFLHGLLDPTLAYVFFWLGLILIVLELLVPGHIFSGTIGTILLVTSLIAFGLLPVRLIGIVLLLAAAVLLIIEAAQPGLGIWGILGIICLIMGGWYLYDRSSGAGVSPWVIVPVAALVGLFFGIVVVKARALRHLPAPAGPEAIVGLEGVALGTGLDPGGTVRVSAEQWQAVSGAGRIPAGARVRVTRIDGLTLTVEPVGTQGAPAGGAPLPPPIEKEGTS